MENYPNFKNTNFEKLKKFNLETDLKAFRKILKDNLGGYVNSKTMTYLSPNSTTSIAYGFLKLHKPEKSLRPICTGYNAICANSQKFLKKFIDPILQEYTFLIDSPAKFKERLIQDTPKYNSRTHTVVSFDAKKLYTNVNVNRVVSHVLDCIYKTPSLFFDEKDDFGNPFPIPPRSNFRIFIQNVLKNFNIIENNLGYYRQIGGLAMGSPLSGSLSNIFIHLMENTVVTKLLKDKTIVHWQRYTE